MTHIIGSDCIDCVDGGCLAVCPVDCIHGPINPTGKSAELAGMSEDEKRGMQLYINPKTCINCAACIPECPVDAIYSTEAKAIANGELKAVNANYEFFGLKFN